jgi:hypothetical protein
MSGEWAIVSSGAINNPEPDVPSTRTGVAGPSRSAHTKFPAATQLAKSNHPATLRAFGLQSSPQRCLTKASGTPAPETTARALAAGTNLYILCPKFHAPDGVEIID